MSETLLPELIKIVIGALLGGGLVALITARDTKAKIKAETEKLRADISKTRTDEWKTRQEAWHKEFWRLNQRIDELEGQVKVGDDTIEEMTTKYKTLKQDYDDLKRSSDKKIAEQDLLIERLSNRIQQLEDLMRKNGIDPNGKGEAK
jgi:predicted RNase H-like nuclease (RuvC/YqgF family)